MNTVAPMADAAKVMAMPRPMDVATLMVYSTTTVATIRGWMEQAMW